MMILSQYGHVLIGWEGSGHNTHDIRYLTDGNSILYVHLQNCVRRRTDAIIKHHDLVVAIRDRHIPSQPPDIQRVCVR